MWEPESVFQSKLLWGTVLFFGSYLYLKFVIFNYWKRQGVPCEIPIIPVGNALPTVLGKLSVGELIKQNYDRFKSQPFHGFYMFHIPYLVINDPDLIRLILVKDFAHFHDRGLHFNKKVDPLSGHLFFMAGEEWRFLRSKLSPIFSSGKIKQLFPLIESVGEDLKKTLNISIEKSNIVEFQDLLSRYTTDVIASIAFGFESNSLGKPESEFREYGKKSVDVNPAKVTLMMFFPKIFDIFRIPINSKEVSKFFKKVFSEMITHRRANPLYRKDFLYILLQFMEHGKVEEDGENATNGTKTPPKTPENLDTISISVACAQAFAFFLAGYESSCSTISYCLHELALNLEIQDKLREEIIDKLGDRNTLIYEDVYAMTYLDKVVSETLRKYPNAPFLRRVCTKDYKIPNSKVCISKGMKIIIPVLGLQNDPNLYPDPQLFKPERFDSDQVAKRHTFTYIPFGEGPRICIGRQFGLLQVKVALIKIISHYKITICDRTEIPLKTTTRNFLLNPEGDLFSRAFLRVERVKEKHIM